MKKVLIIAIGVFFAGAAGAQTVGVKGGVNFSNIIKTNDKNFSTDFKPGLNAGLFLDIPIVEQFSFAPELMFSQKGYKTTGSSLLGPREYSVTTNFIELPILAKINPTSKFSIYAGPQVSFLVSTKEKFTSGNVSYENTVRNDNEKLKKSLVGGVVGIGIGLTNQLSLQARYALDFQKNNENGGSETPIYKNQVIQTGLAYRLK